MGMSSHRESAQIIRFVPRTRLARPDASSATTAVRDLAPQRHPTVACGSGWYHEAAIQDEAHDRRQ